MNDMNSAQNMVAELATLRAAVAAHKAKIDDACEARDGGMIRRYTLAEARFILSHVYCVHCLPDDDGWVYPYASWNGEALCCRCPERFIPDLRLYIATERKAREWLERENNVV